MAKKKSAKGYWGDVGETVVSSYLDGKNMSIQCTNYRCPAGEIDLVAKDGTYTVFVEVKYRKNLSFGLPREAVGYKKQQKIKQSVLYYMAEHQLADQDMRFDVVEVYGNDSMRINHIENAFAYA